MYGPKEWLSGMRANDPGIRRKPHRLFRETACVPTRTSSGSKKTQTSRAGQGCGPGGHGGGGIRPATRGGGGGRRGGRGRGSSGHGAGDHLGAPSLLVGIRPVPVNLERTAGRTVSPNGASRLLVKARDRFANSPSGRFDLCPFHRSSLFRPGPRSPGTLPRRYDGRSPRCIVVSVLLLYLEQHLTTV